MANELIHEDCQGAYVSEKMAGPPLYVLREEA